MGDSQGFVTPWNCKGLHLVQEQLYGMSRDSFFKRNPSLLLKYKYKKTLYKDIYEDFSARDPRVQNARGRNNGLILFWYFVMFSLTHNWFINF